MKKNILKIASIFAITFTLIFGFNLNAEAILMNESPINYDQNGFTLHGNSTTEDYTVKYTVGGNYVGGVAYCLDAQYASDVNNLVDVTDLGNNVKDNAYKAGIIAIFTADNDTSDSTYIAKMLAIRSWSYAFNRGTGSSNTGLYHAVNAGYNLYSSWKADLADLVSTLEQKGVTLSNVSSSGTSFYYTGTGDNLGKAEGYFAIALNAAINSIDNVSTKNANLSQPAVQLRSLEEYEDNGVTKVRQDAIHSFKITNADDKTSFTIRSGINANSSVGLNLNKNYSGLIAYISRVEVNGQVIAEGRDNVIAVLDKDILASYKNVVGSIPNDITINVTAHFEGAKEDLLKNCIGSSIGYDIQGVLNNSVANANSGYIVRLWRNNGSSQFQTYVTVEPGTPDNTPTTTPWRSSNTVSLIENCENPCADLGKKCIDGDIDACKEYIDKDCEQCTLLDQICTKGDSKYDEFCTDYDVICPKETCDVLKNECGDDINADTPACEKYREKCSGDVICDPYISELTCCDNENNLIVGEDKTVPVSIVGPGPGNEISPNLKLCFVDAIDKKAGINYHSNENLDSVSDSKGNTYTFGDLKSNPYCTVSCKEDYVMQMPAAKKINAGRYFTFRASVSGTKACFTNSIDQETFVKDLTRLQNELIAANNEYQTAKALLEGETTINNSSYTSSCSCGTCSCSSTSSTYRESVTFKGLATNIVTSSEIRYGSTISIKSNSQNVSENYKLETLNVAGGDSAPGRSCPDNDGNEGESSCDPCSGDSCTYYSVSQPTCDVDCIKAKIAARRDSAKSTMDGLNVEIENLITLFNQCSSWSTAVKFDPKVTYDYYETDYMNMINKDDNMVKENQTETNTSTWFCNYEEYPSSTPMNDVTVNNDYTECINGVVTGGLANIGNNVINPSDDDSDDSNETRENIFIGDSRTYQMKMNGTTIIDPSATVIACSGRGYGWFTNSRNEDSYLPCTDGSYNGGIAALESKINSNKKYNVIIWMGVNDLSDWRLGSKTPESVATDYVEQYKALLNKYSNINIYVVSVTRINELGADLPTGSSNSRVNAFNTAMKNAIGTTARLNYIDADNAVIPNYIDALHYTGTTYEKYYEVITNALKGDTISKVENDDVTFPEQSDAIYRVIEVTQCAGDTGCGTLSANVSNAKYVRLESSAQATYKPKTLFYNVHTDGTITTEHVDNSDPLENALPVALSRPRGIYNYNIIMKNLGEFYETGTLGRYAGDDSKSLTGGELNYACVYLVNIQKETLTCDFKKNCTDDCVTDCIGPNCDVDVCEGDNCSTDCLSAGCIYDSKSGSTIYNREVSLNNFLYNGTTSYNWDKESKNEKAKDTVEAIQNRGDDIYNDQPLLSVTITPNTARDIREDESNNDLSIRCESMNINGVEYTNTACYSTFIDDILEGSYNMVNEDRSYISDENNRRKESYFKAWEKTPIDDKIMIGPSWK